MDEWDLSLIDSPVLHQLASCFSCARLVLSTRWGGEWHSLPPNFLFLCFCVLARLFSFREITDPDAHDLGPNSWAERSAHMVKVRSVTLPLRLLHVLVPLCKLK